MKKIIYPIIITLIAGAIAAGAVLRKTDVASFLIRSFGNYDLTKRGIRIEYAYVAPGLHRRPYIIPFSRNILKFSLGKLRLDVINTYTTGNYDKDPGSRIPSASNFLDPTSKFKDSWFGVYLIFDDPTGRAKKFMLKNPDGPPGDPSNFRQESLMELPRIDQIIIVNSTRQNQEGHDVGKFIAEFPFKKCKGREDREEMVRDKKGGRWLKISSQFSTISALTDTAKTRMHELYSIKAYVGLPGREVYELVDPWHSIIIKGSLLARYFSCSGRGFWAVVYFNGSSFKDKKGNQYDHWEISDIKTEFEKMFQNLEIECLQ